jgi:hypothetical protein
MTAAAPALVDLRPAPREALTGRAAASGGRPATAERLRSFCCSAASAAFFLSVEAHMC